MIMKIEEAIQILKEPKTQISLSNKLRLAIDIVLNNVEEKPFFCDAKLVNGESICKTQCIGCFKCLHNPK